MLALVNIITQYKLRRVSPSRFRHQIILWLIVLVVLLGSFPLYNYLVGRPPLDSTELSSFDVIQTTAIVFLFYTLHNQRQKSEQTERRLRDLHQALSIKLSTDDKD